MYVLTFISNLHELFYTYISILPSHFRLFIFLMSRSGVEEIFSERDQLLQEVSDLCNNANVKPITKKMKISKEKRIQELGRTGRDECARTLNLKQKTVCTEPENNENAFSLSYVAVAVFWVSNLPQSGKIGIHSGIYTSVDFYYPDKLLRKLENKSTLLHFCIDSNINAYFFRLW